MAALSVTVANVAASAQATIRSEFTGASAAQTVGQWVYLNSSNQWALLDSNASATGNGVTDLVGCRLNAGGVGQPAAVCVKDPNFTPGVTMTNGITLYSSNTAGGITMADLPTTGDYPIALGVARTTTTMNLNPTASGNII